MHFRSCRLHGLYCPAYFFGLESKQDENLTYGLLGLLRGETQQAIMYLGLLRVLPSYCSIKGKMQVLDAEGHRNPSMLQSSRSLGSAASIFGKLHLQPCTHIPTRSC